MSGKRYPVQQPYPIQQQSAHPPAPSSGYHPPQTQPPYNPAYPPQGSGYPPPQPPAAYRQQPPSGYPAQPLAGYPPQAQPTGYPPAQGAGPPPPYYPTDPYRGQVPGNPRAPALYPTQGAASPYPTQGAAVPYPTQPRQASSYTGQQFAGYQHRAPIAVSGSYDSSARFGPGTGATQNIPPPPPGVMPTAAQVATASGQTVVMNQKPGGGVWSGHGDGGWTVW